MHTRKIVVNAHQCFMEINNPIPHDITQATGTGKTFSATKFQHP